MKVYLQSKEDIINSLNTSQNGLSSSEVTARQEKYGKNVLEQGKRKTMLRRIWEQIKDPMILVLIGAAIVSGVFEEVADMVIILIVVVLNAILGIFQESKAEKAIDALQKMSAPHSRVKRNGSVAMVASEDIVPGDIVILEAGDSVPADLRLTESASLKIEEAALTGESVPVEKTPDVIQGETDETPLGDRVNMAYMGTNVAYGRGEGVVTATGMQTEMGKIANVLAENNEEKTPLQKRLAGLSKVLSICVLIICVFVFLFSVINNGGFQGNHVFEALLTAVSLAVAAIPEGLVVVVTVLLSIGVSNMSKRNSIIRRLTAVETLGCTQVICSDKTGTLTQNKMTVKDRFGNEAMLAQAMALCNDVQKDGQGKYLGDPTEIALVEYADSLKDKITVELLPRAGEVPFDSDRKMMSTIHKAEQGKYIQFTKGALDEVLNRCTGIYLDNTVQPITNEHKNQILIKNKHMAGKALRVLAAAFRVHNRYPEKTDSDSVETDLVFIGCVGMIDPIRPEVKTAVKQCGKAGMRPVMITGDHKDTAIAIAKELGILEKDTQAVTGAELSKMSDEEFEKRISDIVVYARVQPEHKVRIVKMWKKIGKITAMTGDGVNDAPAIKSADIGIGMGITGTDVTKNVADMVLVDDNFASIVYAMEEGRRIYENIKKAIQFLLASNLSEVVSIFIATVMGLRLFAPIHILWINLITDTFPAMALGMEKAESDSMEKPPRDAKEGIFAQGLGGAVLWQGVIIGLLTLVSFFIGRATDQITGMTMAFLTLSMCEIFHAINMRSRIKSIFSIKGHNKYLIGAVLLSFVLTIGVIYIPGLNAVMQLTALSLPQFFISFGIALIIIPLVEIVKAIVRTRQK